MQATNWQTLAMAAVFAAAGIAGCANLQTGGEGPQ